MELKFIPKRLSFSSTAADRLGSSYPILVSLSTVLKLFVNLTLRHPCILELALVWLFVEHLERERQIGIWGRWKGETKPQHIKRVSVPMILTVELGWTISARMRRSPVSAEDIPKSCWNDCDGRKGEWAKI